MTKLRFGTRTSTTSMNGIHHIVIILVFIVLSLHICTIAIGCMAADADHNQTIDQHTDDMDDGNNEWSTISWKRSLDTCDNDDVPLPWYEPFMLLYRWIPTNESSLPISSQLSSLHHRSPNSTQVIFSPLLPSLSLSSSSSDTIDIMKADNDTLRVQHHDSDGHERLATQPLLPPPRGANISHADLVFNNISLSTVNQTTYYCAPLAVNFTSKVHVIQIDPIVAPLSPSSDNKTAEVHHIVVWSCIEPLSSDDMKYTGACMEHRNTPYGIRRCTSEPFLAVWAMGGGSFILPRQAGYPLNDDNKPSTQYFVMQLHVHNVNRQPVLSTINGVRLWYSHQLRRYDAGVTGTGYSLWNLTIPPHEPAVAFEAVCPSQCSDDIPSNGVHVFASLLHMHETGEQIWVKHIRNGNELPEIGRSNKFNHHKQVFNYHQPMIKLQAGDSFITRCVYNTSLLTKSIRGGFETTDEMCGSFMAYYPRVKGFRFCASMPYNLSAAIHRNESLPLVNATPDINSINNGVISKWGVTPMYPQLAVCLRGNDTINVNMTDLLLRDEHFNASAAGFTVITIDAPLNYTPISPSSLSLRHNHHRSSLRPLLPMEQQSQQQQCIRSPIPYGSRISGSNVTPISSSRSFSESQFDYAQWLDTDHNIRALWKCDFTGGNGGGGDGNIIIAKRPKANRPVLLPTNFNDVTQYSGNINDRDDDDKDDKHKHKQDIIDNDKDRDFDIDDIDDDDNDDAKWLHKLIRHRVHQLSPSLMRDHMNRAAVTIRFEPWYQPRQSCKVATFAIQVKTKGVIELGVQSPVANGTTDWIVGYVNNTHVFLDDQHQSYGTNELVSDRSQDLYDIRGWPAKRWHIKGRNDTDSDDDNDNDDHDITTIHVPPMTIDVHDDDLQDILHQRFNHTSSAFGTRSLVNQLHLQLVALFISFMLSISSLINVI